MQFGDDVNDIVNFVARGPQATARSAKTIIATSPNILPRVGNLERLADVNARHNFLLLTLAAQAQRAKEEVHPL